MNVLPFLAFLTKLRDCIVRGCGITRAIRALLHGDLYTSFRNNIIVYIDIPTIIILEIIKKNTKKDIKKVYNISIIILLIITIVFGIIRNIPIFSFLAPIDV